MNFSHSTWDFFPAQYFMLIHNTFLYKSAYKYRKSEREWEHCEYICRSVTFELHRFQLIHHWYGPNLPLLDLPKKPTRPKKPESRIPWPMKVRSLGMRTMQEVQIGYPRTITSNHHVTLGQRTTDARFWYHLQLAHKATVTIHIKISDLRSCIPKIFRLLFVYSKFPEINWD
jgi:hypothetical protein